MIIYRIFNKINGKSYIGQSIWKMSVPKIAKELNVTPRQVTWCIKKNNLDKPSKNYWQTNK